MRDVVVLVYANKQDLPDGIYSVIVLLLCTIANQLASICLLHVCALMVSFSLLSSAMSPAEIQEKMDLTRLHNHNWHIQPSSATMGEGLHEGLLWLKLQYMCNKK